MVRASDLTLSRVSAGLTASSTSLGISRETESQGLIICSRRQGCRGVCVRAHVQIHKMQVQAVMTGKWEKPPCFPSQAVEETIAPLEQGILPSGENHSNEHPSCKRRAFVLWGKVMELNLNVDGSEQRFPALFLLQCT